MVRLTNNIQNIHQQRIIFAGAMIRIVYAAGVLAGPAHSRGSIPRQSIHRSGTGATQTTETTPPNRFLWRGEEVGVRS